MPRSLKHFQQKWEAVLRFENATAQESAFSAKVGSGFAVRKCGQARITGNGMPAGLAVSRRQG
jgi:hypothetical protein